VSTVIEVHDPPAVEKQPKKADSYLYQIEQPLVGDRVRKFLEVFEVILKHSNYQPVLDMYARSSNKCGRCSCTCQVYQATKDPRDIPCSRTNMLLDIYRNYFTTAGRLKTMVFTDHRLTEDDIDDMIDSFYRCTACRRCSLECPMGVDHSLITHLGRYILGEMGIPPKALQVSTRAQLEGENKNTSAVPLPAIISNIEFLEEEIEEEKGIKLKVPIDQQNMEYIFFAPVSDFLMEAETLMGIALTMHAMGEDGNWTLGTHNCDAINYGLFYSDWILERNIHNLIDEAHRLNARNILIGECGHASRSAKHFVPVFAGPDALPVINCVELTYKNWKAGKLQLDGSDIEERITYHDPCNIARNGWIVDQPRELLRSFVKNYVEMTPGGANNYCCGGGGGTVSIDEMHDFRMEIGGHTKAEQLKATGADIVIAPCANCKKQLRELVTHYDLPMQVMGLHDLLYKAIKL
jgi:Fe-S oxidoreductase